jgi:hypothetical protein
MIGLVDRALAPNPSFARGWFVSGLSTTCKAPLRAEDVDDRDKPGRGALVAPSPRRA